LFTGAVAGALAGVLAIFVLTPAVGIVLLVLAVGAAGLGAADLGLARRIERKG
jgi:hypothetical protein